MLDVLLAPAEWDADVVAALKNGCLALLCLLLLAAAAWVLRRFAARLQPREGSRFSRADLWSIGLILTLAITAVMVAFLMSAATLYKSATWLEHTAIPINGGDLRFLFPLTLDGLIVLFLALDLWTEWRGIRHPYYRWVAWSLSGMTLYLNITTDDGGSLLGHAAPPLGVIVISEGLSVWIRSLAGLVTTGRTTDRIPLGHWIARPASAWRVFRLMLGWHIASYQEAVEMDRLRCMAYAMLRHHYGKTWKEQTPEHLRWMLDNGYQLDTAYELVRALTGATVAMTAAEIRVLADGREKPALASGQSETGQTTGQRSTLAAGREKPALASGQSETGQQASTESASPEASGHQKVPSLTVIRSSEDHSAEFAERVDQVVTLFKQRPELLEQPMGEIDAVVAEELNVRPRTARRYRKSAMEKLDAEKQDELAAAADGH